MSAPSRGPGWEHLDHTADLGVRATGASLEEAFANAALGMLAQVYDPATVEATGEARIEVEGDDIEELLFDWLDEVLYLLSTDLVLFSSFDVKIAPRREGGYRLAATARGEAYDETRHGHLHEVKAVTYHHLEVQQDPPQVEFIVDI